MPRFLKLLFLFFNHGKNVSGSLEENQSCKTRTETFTKLKPNINLISCQTSFFQWYAVPLVYLPSLPKYYKLHNIENVYIAREQTLSF